MKLWGPCRQSSMNYSAMQNIKILYSFEKKIIFENLLAVPIKFRGP
jgi:hypothetical protein